MGSGAGFPGIILSIFNKNDKFHVKLYEKSNVKCEFTQLHKGNIRIIYETIKMK